MASNIQSTEAGCARKEAESYTVREHLDRQIQMTRERLENLCIAKAKAETIQILDVPMSFIHGLY